MYRDEKTLGDFSNTAATAGREQVDFQSIPFLAPKQWRADVPIGDRLAIVGGIAGWLASMVMNRDNSMGIMLNIIVGCVGSVLGNLLLNQFGIAGSVQNFSLTGLLVAVLGAVVLLGIVNLVRRGSLR